MSIYRIVHSIWNHPFNRGHRLRGLLRFVKWQINNLLNPYRVVYPLTANTVMIAEKGMTGITGCIYNGLLEFEDMFFLLHFLRQGDLFIDIGANVGVYTILSSGEAGADTISIEPIKKTFLTLQTNVALNALQPKVTLLNRGVGEAEGELYFTSSEDTVNHVLSESEKITRTDKEHVKINTLDHICLGKEPSLIKIDVEGFETSVINGATAVLEKKSLKAVIVELNGSGTRYGFDEKKIHEKLLSLGFQCYQYEPYSRTLLPLETYGQHNTIYIRDIAVVRKRVESAKCIQVINKSI